MSGENITESAPEVKKHLKSYSRFVDSLTASPFSPLNIIKICNLSIARRSGAIFYLNMEKLETTHSPQLLGSNPYDMLIQNLL